MKKPYLLIIDELLKQIRNTIRKSSLETGFYLIGIWDEFRGESIVIDFFEFNYLKRNSTFIEVDPCTKIMLINALPIGLSILGHVHSHPFLKSSNLINPSSIDISTFSSYEKGFFGISNIEGETIFYYFDGKKLTKINYSTINYKEFTERCLLKLYTVDIFPVVVKSKASNWEIYSIIFKGYQDKSNLLNILSKIKLKENKIEIQKPAWIDIIKLDGIFKIPYRLYFHSNEKIPLTFKIKNLFGNNIEIYNEKKEKINMNDDWLENQKYKKIFVKKVE